MSKKCAVCDKKPVSGQNVSHANNKTKKRIKPNLKRQRIILKNGQVRQVWVCTSCIKSGKIKKAH